MKTLSADAMMENANVSSTVQPVPTTSSVGIALNSSVSSIMPQPPLLNSTQPDGMLNHINPGALMRGSIVFGVLCVIVVLYIAFRTCRLRRNRKSARYNVLSTHDESAPLHSDDDEETVFDAAGSRR